MTQSADAVYVTSRLWDNNALRSSVGIKAALKTKVRNIRLEIRSRHRFRLEPYPGDALAPRARGHRIDRASWQEARTKGRGQQRHFQFENDTSHDQCDSPYNFFTKYLANALFRYFNTEARTTFVSSKLTSKFHNPSSTYCHFISPN